MVGQDGHVLLSCGGPFSAFGDLVFEAAGGFALVASEGRGVVVAGVAVVAGKDRGEGAGGHGRAGLAAAAGDGGGVIAAAGRWWESEVRFGFGGDADPG